MLNLWRKTMRLRLLSSVAVSGVITCLVSFQAWGECVEAPDCTDLGYTLTTSDCPKGYIKCPWNTGLVYCECSEDYKYTCDGANETAGTNKCGDFYTSCGCASGYKWENGSCVQDRPSCNIGDIFYTDNTCVAATKHNSSKTVLGIVVHVNSDGVGGQIMTPWPIDASGNKSSSNVGMYWSTDNVDIAGLTNYTSAEAASKDYNSCSNTDAIVKQGSASTYPAAWATRKYAPTSATKGKWCLPAAGIITNIYKNKNAINTTISKIGGVTFPDDYVWSSSECHSGNAWYSSFKDAYGLHSAGKFYNLYVRPVLEF